METTTLAIQTLADELNVKELIENANMSITNRQDAEASMIVKNMLDSALKRIESTRDWLVRPYNTIVKNINTMAKSYSEPLEVAKKSLNKKQIEYNAEVDRQAAEKKEEMFELWKENDAKDEAIAEIQNIQTQANWEKVQKWINYSKKIIKVDRSLLPQKYWNIKDMEITPKQIEIKADMKAGIRIDGITFEE